MILFIIKKLENIEKKEPIPLKEIVSSYVLCITKPEGGLGRVIELVW